MQERTPEEVLAMVKDEGCEFVDLRFSDLPGVMQHVTIPASVLSEDHFTDGHGFDGSSVRGFQEIQESDMVLITDPNTPYIDPFMKRKTAVIHCYVADPVTGESYSPRPPLRRPEGRGLPEVDRHRRHRLLRPRGRVLRLRRRALRHQAATELLLRQLDRGPVEHRRRGAGREPLVQAPHQAGLLPGSADGPLPGPALRHVGGPARRRHRDRAAPPRGRLRRPGRDRREASTRCSRWPTS